MNIVVCGPDAGSGNSTLQLSSSMLEFVLSRACLILEIVFCVGFGSGCFEDFTQVFAQVQSLAIILHFLSMQENIDKNINITME